MGPAGTPRGAVAGSSGIAAGRPSATVGTHVDEALAGRVRGRHRPRGPGRRPRAAHLPPVRDGDPARGRRARRSPDRRGGRALQPGRPGRARAGDDRRVSQRDDDHRSPAGGLRRPGSVGPERRDAGDRRRAGRSDHPRQHRRPADARGQPRPGDGGHPPDRPRDRQRVVRLVTPRRFLSRLEPGLRSRARAGRRPCRLRRGELVARHGPIGVVARRDRLPARRGHGHSDDRPAADRLWFAGQHRDREPARGRIDGAARARPCGARRGTTRPPVRLPRDRSVLGRRRGRLAGLRRRRRAPRPARWALDRPDGGDPPGPGDRCGWTGRVQGVRNGTRAGRPAPLHRAGTGRCHTAVRPVRRRSARPLAARGLAHRDRAGRPLHGAAAGWPPGRPCSAISSSPPPRPSERGWPPTSTTTHSRS